MAVKRKSATVRAPARAKQPEVGRAAKRSPAKSPTSKPARKAAAKPASDAKLARRRSGTAQAMFQKVAFTLLSVADPTRARGFYENVLGLTRGLGSPDGTWTEYDLPGGGCIALFRHPMPKFARAPGGGASVALEVADLDAVNDRLKQAGVVYQGDVVKGPRCRMSNILDSEGNSLILHQLDHH